MRIDTSLYNNIVVLTGAGISAGSGLRTYRGPDVNLEPMNPKNPAFKEEYLGKAKEILPELLGTDL
jgi:NAD-dependent SIR2 family protein deacetylase